MATKDVQRRMPLDSVLSRILIETLSPVAILNFEVRVTN